MHWEMSLLLLQSCEKGRPELAAGRRKSLAKSLCSEGINSKLLPGLGCAPRNWAGRWSECSFMAFSGTSYLQAQLVPAAESLGFLWRWQSLSFEDGFYLLKWPEFCWSQIGWIRSSELKQVMTLKSLSFSSSSTADPIGMNTPSH